MESIEIHRIDMKLLLAGLVIVCIILVIVIRFAVTERDMEGY